MRGRPLSTIPEDRPAPLDGHGRWPAHLVGRPARLDGLFVWLDGLLVSSTVCPSAGRPIIAGLNEPTIKSNIRFAGFPISTFFFRSVYAAQ